MNSFSRASVLVLAMAASPLWACDTKEGGHHSSASSSSTQTLQAGKVSTTTVTPEQCNKMMDDKNKGLKMDDAMMKAMQHCGKSQQSNTAAAKAAS